MVVYFAQYRMGLHALDRRRQSRRHANTRYCTRTHARGHGARHRINFTVRSARQRVGVVLVGVHGGVAQGKEGAGGLLHHEYQMLLRLERQSFGEGVQGLEVDVDAGDGARRRVVNAVACEDVDGPGRRSSFAAAGGRDI